MEKEIGQLQNQRSILYNKMCEVDRNIWEIIKSKRSRVDSRTYTVLKLSFNDKKTLEEIGQIIGVTKARVMQIKCQGVITMDCIEWEKNRPKTYIEAW